MTFQLQKNTETVDLLIRMAIEGCSSQRRESIIDPFPADFVCDAAGGHQKDFQGMVGRRCHAKVVLVRVVLVMMIMLS